MATTDYRRILVNVLAGAVLDETDGDRLESAVEALRQAGIIPGQGTDPLPFDDLTEMSDWLAANFNATTVHGTQLGPEKD